MEEEEKYFNCDMKVNLTRKGISNIINEEKDAKVCIFLTDGHSYVGRVREICGDVGAEELILGSLKIRGTIAVPLSHITEYMTI